jgi:hypothetical protein
MKNICYLCKKPNRRCHGIIREIHTKCINELEEELRQMRHEMWMAKHAKMPIVWEVSMRKRNEILGIKKATV